MQYDVNYNKLSYSRLMWAAKDTEEKYPCSHVLQQELATSQTATSKTEPESGSCHFIGYCDIVTKKLLPMANYYLIVIGSVPSQTQLASGQKGYSMLV